MLLEFTNIHLKNILSRSLEIIEKVKVHFSKMNGIQLSTNNAVSMVIDNENLDVNKKRDFTICIGDLHGQIDKFNRIWKRLEIAIGSEAFSVCSVIFLGDFCDRGPHTKDVLECLSTLGKRYPNQRHAFIAGNHDFSMAMFLGLLPENDSNASFRHTWESHLATLPDAHITEGWWKGDGWEHMHLQARRWGGQVPGTNDSVYEAASTFTSYGVKIGDREGLRKAVPKHHCDFLKSLKWVHEEEGPSSGEYSKLIAVHAGLISALPIQPQLEFLNSKDVFQPLIEHLSGRSTVWDAPAEAVQNNWLIVSGHHRSLRTDMKNRLIVDESGGEAAFPLAAVILPNRLVVKDNDIIDGKKL